ncbi:DNA invertase Pin-like site-specific DNA recombinase [Clostridium beijerinckii]|nr:recombinase family protein [Clostridium beijerinckii]NOW84603.1 DNA invertase Pin-like site-specific DNA recombinase [Clostridium beijerinckii]
MKVGYVRISSADQNTARQDVLMQELGVEKIFTDKCSGKNMERPELIKMLEFVREGDTVIVESISRFARNTKDLLTLVEQLEEKQVKFISKKEIIDSSSASGKFVLVIFGAIAELERDYIRDRQREGIDIAIAEGRFNGRPKKKLDNFDGVYNAWKAGEITASKASELLKIGRSTFYRKVKEHEEK